VAEEDLKLKIALDTSSIARDKAAITSQLGAIPKAIAPINVPIAIDRQALRSAEQEIQSLAKKSVSASSKSFPSAGARSGKVADLPSASGSLPQEEKVRGLSGAITELALKSQAIQLLSNAFLGLGQAIAGSVLSAVKQALSEFTAFDQALTEFAAKSGKPRQDLASLGEEAKNLAAVTSFAPAGVAETATALLTLGTSADEVEGTLGGVIKLADVLGEDPVLTGKVLQTGKNIFGEFGETTDSIAETINPLINTTAAGSTGGVAEFLQLFQQAGSFAKAANQDFEDLAAAFATLRDGGSSTEVAATGLRTVLASLSSPTTEAARRLQEAGVQAFDSQGNFVGLNQVVKQFASATTSLSQQEQLDLATTIFGREGAPAILALIQNVDTRYAAALENIRSGTITVQGSLDTLNQSLARQQEILGGNISSALLSVGEAIAPVQSAVVEFLNQVISRSQELGTGFDPLTESGERLKTVLTENPALVERISAAFAKLAEIAVNQVAQIIDAITVLVSNQEFVDTVGSTIEEFGRAFSILGEALQFVLALVDGLFSLKAALSDLPVIGGVFEALSQPIKSTFELLSLLREAVENFVLFFQEKFSQIGEVISGQAELLGKLPGLDGLSERLASAGKSLKSLGKTKIKPGLDFSQIGNFSDLIKQEGGKAAKEAEKSGKQIKSALSPQVKVDPVKSTAAVQKALKSLGKTRVKPELDFSQIGNFSDLIKQEGGKAAKEAEKSGKQIKTALSPQVKGDPAKSAVAAQKALKPVVAAEKKSAEDRVRAQQEANKKILEEFERANRKAEALIDLSAKRRENLAKSGLINLGEGEDLEAAKQKIENQQIAIEADSAKQQIALAQSNLAKIQELERKGVLSAEEAADRKLKIQQEIADNNGRLIDLELKRQELIRQAIERRIDLEAKAAGTALKAQDRLISASAEVLGIQGKLIGAQQGLAGAQARLAEQRAQAQVEAAGEDQKARLKAEDNLAQIQKANLEKRQSLELRSLEITQKIAKLEAERAVISAKIAENEARAALAKAKSSGASKEEIDALAEGLALAKTNTKLAEGNVKAASAVGQIERETLLKNQQAERESFNLQEAKRQQAKKPDSKLNLKGVFERDRNFEGTNLDLGAIESDLKAISADRNDADSLLESARQQVGKELGTIKGGKLTEGLKLAGGDDDAGTRGSGRMNAGARSSGRMSTAEFGEYVRRMEAIAQGYLNQSQAAGQIRTDSSDSTSSPPAIPPSASPPSASSLPAIPAAPASPLAQIPAATFSLGGLEIIAAEISKKIDLIYQSLGGPKIGQLIVQTADPVNDAADISRQITRQNAIAAGV